MAYERDDYSEEDTWTEESKMLLFAWLDIIMQLPKNIKFLMEIRGEKYEGDNHKNSENQNQENS